MATVKLKKNTAFETRKLSKLAWAAGTPEQWQTYGKHVWNDYGSWPQVRWTLKMAAAAHSDGQTLLGSSYGAHGTLQKRPFLCRFSTELTQKNKILDGSRRFVVIS